MSRSVHELQGYAIVLDKISFITRVFEATDNEGFQFNVRFSQDLKMSLKFPTRNEAELQRGLLIQALRES